MYPARALRQWCFITLLLGPGGSIARVETAAGQTAAGPGLTVRWVPERPVQGTLFKILVNVPAGMPVLGMGATLAGETLHFRMLDDSVREALAAVPLAAAAPLELPLIVLLRSGAVDTVTFTIPVARGEYRLEKLTVAPQFGAIPDSATSARIAREQDLALRVSIRSHATTRLRADTAVAPRGSRVTSGFGEGREFNGRVQSRHMGTDFAGGVGSPVLAAARGVVVLVDDFYLAGRVIYIDHGEGLVTAYFHLSRQDVAVGDTVEAGQLIGRVGATGRVTGPHLHWVVRFGRITVDPLSLLALASTRRSRP
jgi:hypothetical protein